MSTASLLCEIKGPVAWLTLNRPEAMNALNMDMLDLLKNFLVEFAENSDVRVVVLNGNGKAFCAGADLKDANQNSEPEPNAKDLIDCAGEVFAILRDFPKPVIAALNGLTLAGGLELAICCDLIVAGKRAKLGDAHANFGVFPGAGGAAILPRLLPLNVAKYLLFTGKFIPATEMLQYGLVNEVVADENLIERVQELAMDISEKSPIGLRRMKAVANQSQDKTRKEALIHENQEYRQHEKSYDMAEGLNAFEEKRKPEFKGI